MSCDICYTYRGELHWYLVDDSYETELCKRCAAELAKEVKVERLPG